MFNRRNWLEHNAKVIWYCFSKTCLIRIRKSGIAIRFEHSNDFVIDNRWTIASTFARETVKQLEKDGFFCFCCCQRTITHAIMYNFMG